jgi:hypothetical protein
MALKYGPKQTPVGGSGDWIEDYCSAHKAIPAPEKFILWSAIWAVGAALERRVVGRTAQKDLFANSFIMLMSPPGVGKSVALSPIDRIMRGSGLLRVAPRDMTKASLVDEMKLAEVTRDVDGKTDMSAPLQIIAPEYGVLIPAHDNSLFSTLVTLYDGEDSFRETRRSRAEPLEIAQPLISLIIGTQPGYLASVLPEEAWEQGFMARMIIIYQDKTPKVSLFSSAPPIKYDTLVSTFKQICLLGGAADFSPGAVKLLEHFNFEGIKPEPTHSKLKHYNTRRLLHILKLSIISAASRYTTRIEEQDVNRALAWLLDSELRLPDVFKDMQGKSDLGLLQDLEFVVRRAYERAKAPVAESRITAFLSSRTPAYNVQNVLKTAIGSDILTRTDKHGKPQSSELFTYFVPGAGTAGKIE